MRPGNSATWEVKQCGAQSVAKLGSGAHIALRQPCAWNLLAGGSNRAIPTWVENVRQHLAKPGEWYYDRARGEIIYLPRKGEDMSQLEAVLSVEETLLQVILPTAPGMSNEGGSSPLLALLPAVSWPWVPACGSLEPPRRDGENAQKTRKNGEEMGEIRPKRCGGVGITWRPWRPSSLVQAP